MENVNTTVFCRLEYQLFRALARSSGVIRLGSENQDGQFIFAETRPLVSSLLKYNSRFYIADWADSAGGPEIAHSLLVRASDGRSGDDG